MRIALLNLPYDNNYGGNLQRYALMTVLERMGHDVTHINIRFHHTIPWYKMPYTYVKRLISLGIGHRKGTIFDEQLWNKRYKDNCKITDVFYNRYICHTEEVYSKKQLKKISVNFDYFLVGSDQVWRKTIAAKWLPTFFLDFLKDAPVKRIAYGVSLGVSENELSNIEIIRYGKLYNKFDAVSARENSALNLFKEYGWLSPQAIQVLDPTLLLTADNYQTLIDSSDTIEWAGDMCCYILDPTPEKNNFIKAFSDEKKCTPYTISLSGKCSIEQWLRAYSDAKYVITDSFHGVLFSIIFNKPFYLFRNEFRGNARFDSICSLLGVELDKINQDWSRINTILETERANSLEFIKSNLI